MLPLSLSKQCRCIFGNYLCFDTEACVDPPCGTSGSSSGGGSNATCPSTLPTGSSACSGEELVCTYEEQSCPCSNETIPRFTVRRPTHVCVCICVCVCVCVRERADQHVLVVLPQCSCNAIGIFLCSETALVCQDNGNCTTNTTTNTTTGNATAANATCPLTSPLAGTNTCNHQGLECSYGEVSCCGETFSTLNVSTFLPLNARSSKLVPSLCLSLFLSLSLHFSFTHTQMRN